MVLIPGKYPRWDYYQAYIKGRIITRQIRREVKVGLRSKCAFLLLKTQMEQIFPEIWYQIIGSMWDSIALSDASIFVDFPEISQADVSWNLRSDYRIVHVMRCFNFRSDLQIIWSRCFLKFEIIGSNMWGISERCFNFRSDLKIIWSRCFLKFAIWKLQLATCSIFWCFIFQKEFCTNTYINKFSRQRCLSVWNVDVF